MSSHNKILVFIFLIFCWIGSQGQNMINIECPETIDCLDGDLVLEDMTPWVDLPIMEVMNCGSTPRSQMNFRFEAKSKSMSLELTYDNPETNTFKLGIVTACMPHGTCVAFQNCAFDSQPMLEVDDLMVGHEYIIFVDECGYETPFELAISPGSDDPFDAIVDINIDYTNCTFPNPEPNVFCVGVPLEWTFILEDESLNNTFSRQEATYNIIIDGPETYEYQVDNYRNFLFEVITPGDYVLCLENVDLTCGSYDIGICKDFSIRTIDESFGTFEICQHDIEEGLWVPGDAWLGEPISEEGFYSFDYNLECDCPFNQTVEVIQLDEVIETVEFVLCPDDYPFEYFNGYTFDYSQFDIITDLEIFRGSLQRDYNNDRCDSLVHLVLINEEPYGRCSSCDMPLSLEKSKIVYCIPFDNEAVDVSGKQNRVSAVGIAFDDNGSSNNILWEAVFDGDGDYVSLPHMDDLNTSVFSFNFQFNKDDSFENGNIETLISKGDIGKDNLRFDVSIEKVNESIFDLVSTFYTPSGSVEIEMPDLQIFKWYDVAYIVETDSIALYLDGYVYEKIPVNANLRGNEDRLYLGTLANNQSRTQYYNGRMDDFKYWKQKLSGQDVLFLHFPEKEFEIEQSYFLSCCEQAEFRDLVIDINNPLDSVIVPNASPTGYDSVYILNYIQADAGPEINLFSAPTDIVVQYQQSCQEFCQSTIDWSTDLTKVFTDNCGDVTVSQSHPFEVTLDENISFIDVEITGTDICGQSTTYSFALELECLPSNVIEVPNENSFEILSNSNCINSNDEICVFSDIQLQFGFIDQVTNSFQPYEIDSNFDAVININGIEVSIPPSNVNDGYVLDDLVEGSYTICLQNVSNACTAINSDICQTINLQEENLVDHGQVISCRDDLASSLPSAVSPELSNLILSNPQETTISISEIDDCGCQHTEKIDLVINESMEEELSIELCQGDVYDDRTENEMYTVQLLTSEGCDSLIHIDLMFSSKTEEMVFAEICEGESYEGYTEEGTYEENYTNYKGCDSTLTIQLSILPKSYDELFVEICPDSLYLGLNETGIYEFLDTNTLGCDSLTTLNLTVLEETHPSCFVSSLQEISNSKTTIYPNPASEVLSIKSDQNIDTKNSTIYNIEGKIVLRNEDKKQIDISELTRGVYVIKIQSSDLKLQAIRFVKN